MFRFATRLATGLFITGVLSAPALAQVRVQDAWVRGTVAPQTATGLFAQITAAQGGRLVGGASPIAGVVEIHEMRMDGTTMRMRAVPALDLPAGQSVALSPGGHHLMLMDLKQPLKAGDTVTVSLIVEGPGGRRETVEVKAAVRPLGAMPAAHGGHGAHGSHGSPVHRP